MHSYDGTIVQPRIMYLALYIYVKGFKKKTENDIFQTRKKIKVEECFLMIKIRIKKCIIIRPRMVIKNDRYNVMTVLQCV